MNKLSIFALFLGLLSTFGCSPDFDPGSRVVSFRVLAQQADLPFAKPGETVKVTSLSYDPEGRSVTWAWAACLNPAASTVEGCLGQIAIDAATSGATPILAQGPDLSDFSYTIPDNALEGLPSSAKSSALVGLLSVACPGDLSFEQTSQQMPFICKERGTGRVFELDEYVVGLKRIQIRETDRNQNPVLERIVFDGADWPETEVKTVVPCHTDNNDYKPCPADTKHSIGAHPSASSVEAGKTEFGLPFAEQVVLEYYATEGLFEHDVKIAAQPDTGWVARSSASGRDLTMWLVAHDDRGGTAWAERHVHVQ